jgi:hypothetical protein
MGGGFFPYQNEIFPPWTSGFVSPKYYYQISPNPLGRPVRGEAADDEPLAIDASSPADSQPQTPEPREVKAMVRFDKGTDGDGAGRVDLEGIDSRSGIRKSCDESAHPW